MKAQRFEALADAFGGAITRWPAEDQDAAFAFLAEAPEVAAEALAGARNLDDDLDAAERLSPSHDLRQRILNAAPAAARSPARRWLTGASLGLGLAAAASAGIAIGVNMSLASAGEDAMLMAAVYSAGMLDEPGDAS